MKKFMILFMMFCSLYFSGVAVEARSIIYDEVEQFVYDYSHLKSTWVGAKIRDIEKLYDINNDVLGWLFRIYNKNQQQGYVIYMVNNGITVAKFTGEDMAKTIKGKVYYISPNGFMTKQALMKNYDALINSQNYETDKTTSGTGTNVTQVNYDENDDAVTYNYNDITFYINISHVPNLSSNTESYSITYYSELRINNIPSYLNDLDNIWGSCAPTAGSMLVAYYDNELWDNLSVYDGASDFPLLHENNLSAVNSLIFELAGYYRTCKNMDATYRAMIIV